MGRGASESATVSGVPTPRVGAPCVPHPACRRHACSSCLRQKQRACMRAVPLCAGACMVPLCARVHARFLSVRARRRTWTRATLEPSSPARRLPPRTRRRYTLLTPLSNSHNFRCKSFQGSYVGMTTSVLTPLHQDRMHREVAQGVQAALDSVEQHLSTAPIRCRVPLLCRSCYD